MLLLTFKVKKFVHNAKPEELTYDKLIELAKAHHRACQEYQMHKQAHSMAPRVTTLILCYKQVLCQSFQKCSPKKTYGKCRHSYNHVECPAHGTTCICGKKNHWAQQCRSSGRRHSSSGCSPSPGRPQKQRQRRFSGKQFNKGRGQGGRGGNAIRTTLPPKDQVLDVDVEASHTRPFTSQLLMFCEDHHTRTTTPSQSDWSRN